LDDGEDAESALEGLVTTIAGAGCGEELIELNADEETDLAETGEDTPESFRLGECDTE
jgi:hypothetical protein